MLPGSQLREFGLQMTEPAVEAAACQQLIMGAYLAQLPLLEDDQLYGVGPYGQAKVEAEGLCEEYRAQGMWVPILRPKSFLGPERLGIFAMLYEWAKEGKKVDWQRLMPPRGFRVLPRRWVVERTFAWICHNRRMAKDYERLCATGEAFVYAAMTRLMVRRLARV